MVYYDPECIETKKKIFEIKFHLSFDLHNEKQNHDLSGERQPVDRTGCRVYRRVVKLRIQYTTEQRRSVVADCQHSEHFSYKKLLNGY